MIKTTCEIPRCLIEREDEFNDFDFILYHQYLKDDFYRNHYREKRINNPDRLMILDNSAYEFFVSGESFVEEDFIRVIKELNPTFYIVPDVLMSKEKTLENFYHWLDIIPSLPSTPYFVPQGRTWQEWLDCVNVMTRVIRERGLEKRLCIPFHNDFFRDEIWNDNIFNNYIKREDHPVPTIDDKYAVGRMCTMRFITRLFPDYKFHMLGSHNPVEIKFYATIPSIETFDSGYPVKLAMAGVRMGEEKEKPNIIIDNFYDKDLTDDEKSLIIYNIKYMKKSI